MPNIAIEQNKNFDKKSTGFTRPVSIFFIIKLSNTRVNTAGWSGWEKVVVFSEMQFFSSDIITIPPNGVSDVVFDLSGKMNEIHYASLIITGHNRSFATLINASVKKLTFAVYNLENAEIKIAAWGFAI